MGSVKQNDNLIINCEEVAKKLKTFFSCAVKNLDIPNYENHDSLSENIDHPTLNTIIKWRNLPFVLAIPSEHKNITSLIAQGTTHNDPQQSTTTHNNPNLIDY